MEPESAAIPAKSPRRNAFLCVLSILVVLIVLVLSSTRGGVLFTTSNRNGWGWQPEYLVPYATCLAGVLLFIMGTARAKGDDWDLRRYWGEHAYRIAQAFAYLFVVWWAWGTLGTNALEGIHIGPNILGFLVGFFILRVERAMDGLGEKFEEVLFAVLPRTARYTAIEERKRQQVRAGYKLTDIATQWEVVSAQISDEETKKSFEDRLERAIGLAAGTDVEKSRLATDEVSRMFQRLKSEAGEVVVPLDDVIGPRYEKGPGNDE